MENPAGFEDKKNSPENGEQDFKPIVEELSRPDNFTYSGTGTAMSSAPSAAPDSYEGDFSSKEFLGAIPLMKIALKMLAERFANLIGILILFNLLTLPFIFIIIQSIPFSSQGMDEFLATLIPAYLVLFVVGTIEYIAIFEMIGDKSLGITDSLKRALSKFTLCVKGIFALAFFTMNYLFVFFLIFYPSLSTYISQNGSVTTESLFSLASWLGGLFFLLLWPFVITLLFTFQYFFLFLLIIEGTASITEAIAISYGMIKHKKGSIIWRFIVFLCVFLLISFPISILSSMFPVFGIFINIAAAALGVWALEYFYAMYLSLKAVSGITVDPQDLKKAKIFIKTGAVLTVIIVIVAAFGFMYTYKTLSSRIGPDRAQVARDASKDSDSDGFLDGLEKKIGTDPNQKDTDGDDLSDYEEFMEWGTDPLKVDTDGDGYKDGEEVVNGYDPLGPGKLNKGDKTADAEADISTTAKDTKDDTANPWIYGVCSDIGVYPTDVEEAKQWKISNTVCSAPQCNSQILASDNNLDFSAYPARDACKAVGGRLPTRAELSCIYDKKLSLGSNFQKSYYWTGEDCNDTNAWGRTFEDGSNGALQAADRTISRYVRCVKDDID